MIIRSFEETDKDDFMQLCSEFYSSNATLKPFCSSVAEKTFAHVLEQHENLWGYMMIDSENGQKIGYALVTSYWCNEEGGNVLVLDELFISPNNRHHGYASRFLEWLEQEYKGKATSITLEVLTTNQTAQSLYRKEGMEPDGFQTMTKNLD